MLGGLNKGANLEGEMESYDPSIVSSKVMPQDDPSIVRSKVVPRQRIEEESSSFDFSRFFSITPQPQEPDSDSIGIVFIKP